MDKKATKCIDIMKGKEDVRRLLIGVILSGLATIGMGVKTFYDYKALEPEELDNAILTLKESEYGDYVRSKEDEYCSQLCEGKINTDEYCELCQDLNSEEGVVAWARTLEDETVNEVINVYDMAKRDRLKATIANTTLLVGSAGLATYLGAKYLNKKSKYEEDKKIYDKKYKNSGYIPRSR